MAEKCDKKMHAKSKAGRECFVACEDKKGHFGWHRAVDPFYPGAAIVWDDSCYGDPVDHPLHYIEGRKYEPADVIIDWQLPWALGNAVKYISRCGRKTNAVEDLKKAVWYINREIRRLEEEKA